MVLPKIEAFATREALYDAAASVVASALTDAVAKRGQAGFAATGGSTPAPVYDRLATMTVPWDKVTVTLTDERFVPPSDPSSNEGLVRRHLLQGRQPRPASHRCISAAWPRTRSPPRPRPASPGRCRSA